MSCPKGVGLFLFWGGAFKIQFFIDVLGPGGGTFFGEGDCFRKDGNDFESDELIS